MTDLTSQIIGAESGGRNIGNPRSSAYGPGQFLRSTWLDMIQRYRPDLASLPQDQQLALRSDPAISRFMTDAYSSENAGKLKAAGFDATPGNTYLAHFAGPQGALKVLQADVNAPAASVLGQQVAQANPFLANMTIGQLRSWADRKMGAPIPPSPIPMPQQAAPNLPLFPQNAQANAAPQQQPPVTPMPDSVWQQAFALSPQPNTPSSIWQTLGVPPSQAPQGLGWLDPKYQNTFGG
jgi:hypothetical protein